MTQTNPKKLIEITTKDLPLSCPMPDMIKWNNHPKVFLTIDLNQEIVCPYCSTHYKLISSNQ